MSGLDGLRQWKCKNGHVLGVILRVEVSSDGVKHRVSRLMLFRAALEVAPVTFGGVDVIASIEGTVSDIRCSCCGEARTWWMGEDALNRFLDKYKKGE